MPNIWGVRLFLGKPADSVWGPPLTHHSQHLPARGKLLGLWVPVLRREEHRRIPQQDLIPHIESGKYAMDDAGRGFRFS